MKKNNVVQPRQLKFVEVAANTSAWYDFAYNASASTQSIIDWVDRHPELVDNPNKLVKTLLALRILGFSFK